MPSLPPLQPFDLVALAILAVAGLRGLFLGMLREAFSIASLAAAVVVVRVWNPVASPWVGRFLEGHVDEAWVPWISGGLLVVGTVGLVLAFGAVLRQGAHAAGLGLADRAAGAALGLAEGAVVAGVLLVMLSGIVGRDHAFVAGSHSLATLERIEHTWEARKDVAAPPPTSS